MLLLFARVCCCLLFVERGVLSVVCLCHVSLLFVGVRLGVVCCLLVVDHLLLFGVR